MKTPVASQKVALLIEGRDADGEVKVETETERDLGEILDAVFSHVRTLKQCASAIGVPRGRSVTVYFCERGKGHEETVKHRSGRKTWTTEEAYAT